MSVHVCNSFFFPSGSFATASCLVCKHKVDCEVIREDIFNQVFILCPSLLDYTLNTSNLT